MFNQGFGGKKYNNERIPPGQYLEKSFPVLSAGPTIHINNESWDFSIEENENIILKISWNDLMKFPTKEIKTDIHCVTKWSKLDTSWEGISFDEIFSNLSLKNKYNYVMAFSDGGYTTNVPIEDIKNGKGFLAYKYDNKNITPEHGGPVRLLIPHLYFWKSAKWIRGIKLLESDEPGFWEKYGYHMYGDPWKEQRYQGD
ncbi:MAG: sulfite oxidase-like oxidoreductase [Chloroflexi bacterium]|nr:sulfite oxidase-like oxidoreductase [Chloroflexota bacterium]